MIRHLLGLLLLSACAREPVDGASQSSIALPDSLREVSGLAAASPGSVFAHSDEGGVVHEIGLTDGRVIRSFALGDPVEADDFEGIAADGERIYLITSEGRMLVASAGANGARVPFEEYDTGVGRACEIEGLSLAPEPGNLLIVCKAMLRGERRGTLVIYQWNTATHDRAEEPWREIDLTEALRAGRGEFAPSGIEWVPETRQLLVISARGRSMLVLDESGRVLSRHPLNAASHPQAEGVTVVGSNQLVIADEGADGRPGRLSVYPYPLPEAGAQ